MGKSSCGNQSQRRLLEYLCRFLSLFVCGVLTGSAACSEAVHRALPVHVLPRQERRERRALRGRRGHLLHPHQRSARLRAPVSLARLGMGWEITPGVTGMLGGHSLGVNQLNQICHLQHSRGLAVRLKSQKLPSQERLPYREPRANMLLLFK